MTQQPSASAAALAQRRDELGLSQGWTAAKIGVSQATLSRWESGKQRVPNLMAWRAWRRALGLKERN